LVKKRNETKENMKQKRIWIKKEYKVRKETKVKNKIMKLKECSIYHYDFFFKKKEIKVW
jgi:hypothetical protein